MRPVNLLPARYRPARATGERRGIGYAAIAVLAVLFVMVLAYVLTKNGINDANEDAAKARAEEQAAQARIGQLQAYGDFATLKASREQAVASVAQVRFDYERLMREMALVLPKDVYLTTFTSAPGGEASTAEGGAAAATGPQLALAGCAPNHRGVATTVVRLRRLHNVADVALQSSTRAASGAQSGPVCDTQWNATVSLQTESSSTATAPVPARLGGGQ